jgi:predicted transcriptional regulator
MSTMALTLDARHMDALEALAAEQGMSKTQVMRQALRLYQMVHLRAKAGEQLAFTKDGKVVPILVLSMLPLEGKP